MTEAAGTAYSVAITTPAAAAGAAYAVLVAPTSNDVPMAVEEIGIILDAATESSIGLVMANSKGTASTSVAGLPEGEMTNTPNSSSVIASAWSAAPTLPGTPRYLRKAVAPATAGYSITWTWSAESPLILPVNTGLLVWNFGAGAGSALSLYVRWTEAQRLCQPRMLMTNSPAYQSIVTG